MWAPGVWHHAHPHHGHPDPWASDARSGNDVTTPSARAAATGRYLGWGRIGAGASLLVALLTDQLGGYTWFVTVVAVGGTILILLGLTTLVTATDGSRHPVVSAVLGWGDLAVFALLVAAGADENAGYVIVLLVLMLMLAALRGLRVYRTALVLGVASEVVRQALHPVIGEPISPAESLVGVGLAVAVSAALARMVELARDSERDALRSADAATAALAEAELAASQLDVLHRVVVSTIGSRERTALQKIVIEVATYLQIPAATVFLLDDGGAPRVAATSDEAVAARDDVAPITRGPFLHGPLGRALDGAASRAAASELEAMAAAGHPVHGDISIHPLRRAGGSVVGALACGTDPGRAFTATEVRTIARFADQMSLAIEAARSLDREADLAVQYRELDRLKTDFIAITSHELRTPLTTVLGVIETMRQRLDELDRTEIDRLVDALARQAERLSRLVDDLGTVSHVDAGTLVIVPRPTDVVGVVHEALATLPAIPARLHIDRDVPEAEADPDRLLQVLTNLITNGDQHGEGAVHVEVTTADDDVVLRVWDEGPGIPMDRREEVFDRFVRLGETDSHSRGSGLGLAIARELVVAMGGTIRVVPLDEHTAFEIRLPGRIATA